MVRRGPAHYEPPSRTRPIWPWLLGIGALLALLVGGWFLYDSIQSQLKDAETVAVPYVVGLRQAQAENEITEKGLVSRVRQISSSDVEEGFVITQNPNAGTVVVEGTRVRINVSKGSKPVTVPNVVNLPFEQAQLELQQAGFNVSRIDVASDLKAGIVVRQDPTGGSESSKGSTVTLSVSQGPSTTAVPDVTTQDFAIAQATLEAAGFRWRVVYEDTTEPSFDGIVISQDPLGGSQAKPDSLVTLFVGRFTGETTTTES